MKTYLVVEREWDKQFLEFILPEAFKPHLVITSAGFAYEPQPPLQPSKQGVAYEAQSLATSMLMTRGNPVGLVINANTEDTQLIEMRRAYLLRELGSYLSSADAVYAVFMAVPSLEIALIDPALHSSLVDLPVLLTSAVLKKVRQHPLIVELIAFIRENIAEKQPS
jgi:hypothetical protein